MPFSARYETRGNFRGSSTGHFAQQKEKQISVLQGKWSHSFLKLTVEWTRESPWESPSSCIIMTTRAAWLRWLTRINLTAKRKAMRQKEKDSRQIDDNLTAKGKASRQKEKSSRKKNNLSQEPITPHGKKKKTHGKKKQENLRAKRKTCGNKNNFTTKGITSTSRQKK